MRAAVPQLAIRDPLATGLDNRLGLGRLVDRRAEHGHERGVQTLIARDAVGAANDSRLIEGADRRHQDLASTELQRISATTHSRLGGSFRRIQIFVRQRIGRDPHGRGDLERGRCADVIGQLDK